MDVGLLSLALKDYLLGFFMALSLRRGRIEQLIARVLPDSDSTTDE